ncbi:hypothetical protein AMJ57_02705 [Parcubacteria bacterium SG8_24]|nr:MAG: hypothetical protein AMJ57_02705 [Parcubacteria bacterium SG8_24]
MRLEPVIGLEIHVQLKTASKMFCGCSNRGEFEPPNTTVCPVCLGHPGTLPVINGQALAFGVLIGRALGCRIADRSKFDRKNYFYPDLPKGYQISQFDLPIALGGKVNLEITGKGGETRQVTTRINRLHLEEDAAKLHHAADRSSSLVDFNRSGTPLAEIVTEPDLRSPAEAKAFLQELRLIMRYLGVSDADMEKGHLRCDANISLREIVDEPREEGWAQQLNPKTEIKNLNTFRAVERALEYEIKRQTGLWLDSKMPTVQSTRGWDETRGLTVEQRTKEEAFDYRYFPEPDLPPLNLHDIEGLLDRPLPELPDERRRRFMREYGFTPADARTLCDAKEMSEFAERVMSELDEWISSSKADGPEPLTPERRVRLVSGWLLTKLRGVLSERKIGLDGTEMTPENFAELLSLIHTGQVTGPSALTLLEEMVDTGADPSIIMKEKNLGRLDDDDGLRAIIANVIAANDKAVNDWRQGKENALQFLIGQTMKATKGKADPEDVRIRLTEALDNG